MDFARTVKENDYGVSLNTVQDCENHLKENYRVPGNPIAFSGIQTIYDYYRGKLQRSRIKVILSEIESYTLHREYHNQTRNPSYTHFKRHSWQMDLVDVQALEPFNKGVRYIMTVIDTFTKFSFCRLLKDKTGELVLSNFKSVLEEAKGKPLNLVIDGGAEFRNRIFSSFCSDQNITLINPDSSTHGAYIERFNRTLQSLIYKYMSENETNTYVNVFQDLVRTYNTRKHRMIGTTPFIAETDDNSHKNIRLLMSKYWEKIKRKPVVLAVGDTVRVAKIKNKFSRGYHQRSNEEMFKVYKISTKMPIPLYYLETYDGKEQIKGGFYSFELTKVSGDVFRIEKILKRRTKDGQREMFVKWKGFNDTYNSWIKENNIVQDFFVPN